MVLTGVLDIDAEQPLQALSDFMGPCVVKVRKREREAKLKAKPEAKRGALQRWFGAVASQPGGVGLGGVGDVKEEAQVRHAIAASLADGGSATGSASQLAATNRPTAGEPSRARSALPRPALRRSTLAC